MPVKSELVIKRLPQIDQSKLIIVNYGTELQYSTVAVTDSKPKTPVTKPGRGRPERTGPSREQTDKKPFPNRPSPPPGGEPHGPEEDDNGETDAFSGIVQAGLLDVDKKGNQILESIILFDAQQPKRPHPVRKPPKSPRDPSPGEKRPYPVTPPRPPDDPPPPEEE